MSTILYQIFKIILSMSSRTMRHWQTNNTNICQQNLNWITIKIKTGYYLELSASETMNILGCREKRITKDKNGENTPQLEVTEVVLINCKLQYISQWLKSFTYVQTQKTIWELNRCFTVSIYIFGNIWIRVFTC